MKNFYYLSYVKLKFVLLILLTNTKLGFALISLDFSTCMVTTYQSRTESEYPACTFHISDSISAHEVSWKCISAGILQIQGDYREFYINCTASYPLDFRFDGHTPTEAIHTNAYATVQRNSKREIKSFHMNIKVFSIPSLHEYYTAMYPNKGFHHHDAYNYSRTGNYIFSGYHNRKNHISRIYIFFEEKWALRSFIKNEHVRINVPTEEQQLPLIVPCRPSHLNDTVTIAQLTDPSAFNYDATVGFTSSYPWKEFMMNNQQEFTCVLGDEGNMEKVVEFFTLQLSVTNYGLNGLGTETRLIFANVEKKNNRAAFVRIHCHNKNDQVTGPVTISIQHMKNPTEYRFRRHFVLPMFSNRSYTTAGKNTIWSNGVALGDLTTTALTFNAMCSDSTNYDVKTIGVGLIGRLSIFRMGEEFSTTRKALHYGSHQYFLLSHDQHQGDLHEGQLVMFQCKILSFLFIPPVIWYSVRRNGSIVEESIVYEWDKNSIAHTELRISKDLKEIICAACVWHVPVWHNLTMNITVRDPVQPTFDLIQNSTQEFHEHSTNQLLKCTASGKPVPDMWWQRNGQNISSTTETITESHERTAFVNFQVVSTDDEGEYVCFASNIAKLEKRAFTVKVILKDLTEELIRIGMYVAICICAAIAVSLVVYFRKCRKKEEPETTDRPFPINKAYLQAAL